MAVSTRVEVLPKFANACGLRDDHGGSRDDLLDGGCQVTRGQVRVPLHHAQSPPPAQLLNRAQVYPSRHETGSEGMPKSVPRHSIEPGCLVLPARRPKRSLCGCHGAHELPGKRPVGSLRHKLLEVRRTRAYASHARTLIGVSPAAM